MRFFKLIFKHNIFFAYIITVFSTFWSLPVHSLGSLQSLGFLNGADYSAASAVSADGSIAVGISRQLSKATATRAFQWSAPVGMVNLGLLEGGFSSMGYGISATGSVIVGTAVDDKRRTRAFRWTEATGMISLGNLNNGSVSWAYGVSGDGNVVIGEASDGEAEDIGRAFIWTQAQGMRSLGTLNAGLWSAAYAISADGNVVVGESQDASVMYNGRAFLWTRADEKMIGLGTLQGGTSSAAYGVNANGKVVVGASMNGAAGNFIHAFRWTEATGMVDLGSLGGRNSGCAYGTSADGNVVVGETWEETSFGKDAARGFRWTKATGMQSIEEWLGIENNGRNGPLVSSAQAISADGSVVVGILDNNEAFLARGGSGLIGFEDVSESLSGNTAVLPLLSTMGSMILHGANGYPLSKLLTEEEDSCAWMVGDWGSLGSGGRAGLGEVGVCHRLSSHIQANIGIGKDRASQALSEGGKAVLEGNYLLVQLMRELPMRGVWLSMGGIYQGGTLNIRRTYWNSGMLDGSTDEVHTQMPAIRSRLDWYEGLQLKRAFLTPYVELSRMYAKVKGYTESEGSFPASFNARKEAITEARVGVQGRLPVGAGLNLLGRLEGVHRFEKQGVNTTGELVGLFNFDMPGQSYQRYWLRGSLGFNHHHEQKVFSLLLHGTTHGQDPKWWLAASYAVKF